MQIIEESSSLSSQKTYIYVWIPAKSPSNDMSSTLCKITRHNEASGINDMPKVELAIGRVSKATLALNTWRFTDTSELLLIPPELFISQNPSSGSLKLFSICSISESPPCLEYINWGYRAHLVSSWEQYPYYIYHGAIKTIVVQSICFFVKC